MRPVAVEGLPTLHNDAARDGLVSLKGGLRRVVIRPLRTLGILALSRDTMPRPAPGRRRRHQAELSHQTSACPKPTETTLLIALQSVPITFLQVVQVVRPGLQHLAPLIKPLSAIVGPAVGIPDGVAQLHLNPLGRDVQPLRKDRPGRGAEPMRRHLSSVAHIA